MSGPPIRVAALPRDSNPYQSLLYDALEAQGAQVEYLGGRTGSRTANVLLLPFQMLARRKDVDVVHLHWVWAFQLPGRGRSRLVGIGSQAWFSLFLRTVRASGARLVWTAHNVLPHEPVFWDDLRARRALGSAADLVLAHNTWTLAELTTLGVHPRRTAVVPHGPYTSEAAAVDVARDGTPSSGPIRIGFVGNIAQYKGIEDLLAAFERMPRGAATLVVAGGCANAALERRVRATAARIGSDVELHIGRLDDAGLAAALADVDVLALPYREVSTSGSVILGLGAGLPVIVPDLPGLADLPEDGVIRYARPADLEATLREVAGLSREQLRAMGTAGRDALDLVPWDRIAAMTLELFRDVVTTPTDPPR